MSQHALDLGMLQEQIASPARHERGVGQEQLSDDGRIAQPAPSRRISAISAGNAKYFK
jgi:hypothetical protein